MAAILILIHKKTADFDHRYQSKSLGDKASLNVTPVAVLERCANL